MSRKMPARLARLPLGLSLLFLVPLGLAFTAGAAKPVGGPIVIRAELEKEAQPSVAYNTEWQEYLVVFWNDRPGNDDIRAERVSKHGALLGGRWIAAGSGADRRRPDVAYNEQLNQYLIVWEEETGGYSLIRSLRLSAKLEPQPEGVQTLMAGFMGQATSLNPAVAYAFTANKYLVVWDYELNIPPNPVTSSILGRIVTAGGKPDGAEFAVSEDTGNDPREHPDLAYNVARNEYLVVWQHPPGPDLDIYGKRVTGHGDVLPGLIPITPYSADQQMASVAAQPGVGATGQYLVAWEETLATEVQIFVRRIDGLGNRVGSQVFALAPGHLRLPAVAANLRTGMYLVVATQEGGAVNDRICGQEVNSAAVRVGQEWCVGGPLADYGGVAAGPLGAFLLTWQDQGAFDPDSDIYGHLWANRVHLPIVLR